jgi:hypothetical protein
LLLPDRRFRAAHLAHAADAAPAPEHTFTSNVTLASEYIYRGIGQTNRKARHSRWF